MLDTLLTSDLHIFREGEGTLDKGYCHVAHYYLLFVMYNNVMYYYDS